MKRTLLVAAVLGVVVPAAAQRGGSGRSSVDVWPELAKRYDKNQDGKISLQEYPRGERAFGNLDRNRDGSITEEDFARAGRSRRGGSSRRAQMAAAIVARADGDDDRKVTAAEWKAHLAVLDADQDGVLGAKEIGAALGMPGGNERMLRTMTGRLDKNQDGAVQVTEIEGMFAELDADKNGELAGRELPQRRSSRGNRAPRARQDGAPKAGDAAPDFELPLVKQMDKTVKLSSFRGQRPVALIFGSYT